MYSISAHICSSFYKSMPICAILIGQAINDTEVDAKLAAVRGMWQRFTYHQAIKQEAERQKQQYNYTEEWATYYSSLTDDDAFSTLIQVFHTWCTNKPILSYYICLHCPSSSNSRFTGWIRQYVSIVTFTKRCEQSRNLTFFWHYVLELSTFFWSVAWEQVLHYKLHNDKWRIEQKKDNKHFGIPDTCRMQRL